MPKTPIEELFRSFPSPDGWGGHYLEPDLTAYRVLKDPNAALFVEYDGYWRHGEREGRTRDQSKNEALLTYGPPGSCVLRISHTHSRGLKDQLVGNQVRKWDTKRRASLEKTLTDMLKQILGALDKVLCPRVANRLDLEAGKGSVRVSARTDIFVKNTIALRGGNTWEEISDYLEAEGFSKEEIELFDKRSSLSGKSITGTLQPRIQWLLSLGIKQARVAKAIGTFPNILSLSVEQNLKPTVQWLLDTGLNEGQVAKAVAVKPQLLCYSIEQNLKPTVQWLLNMGLSKSQVAKAIAVCPSILGYSIDQNLKPTVQWLLDMGLSKAQVSKAIADWPSILGYSIDLNLKPTVQWFFDIGLSQAQVSQAIARKPQLLGYSIEENLKPTVQWLLDMGLSDAQVVKAITTSPHLLGYSIEENLKPTVQWFLDIGLGKAQVAKAIASSPSLLGYSIKANLKPTVQWFLDAGLSMDQVVNVVANYPSTLGAGIEKNLKPVRQWLLHLGLSEDQVVDILISFPVILLLRLEQNLKPKHALLEGAFGRSKAATLVSKDPRLLSYSYERLATRLRILSERSDISLLLSAMRSDKTTFAKRFLHKPRPVEGVDARIDHGQNQNSRCGKNNREPAAGEFFGVVVD